MTPLTQSGLAAAGSGSVLSMQVTGECIDGEGKRRPTPPGRHLLRRGVESCLLFLDSRSSEPP